MTYLIKDSKDFSHYIGRSGYSYPFDRIEDNHLILKNGSKIEYKFELPKDWQYTELLEPNCHIQIFSENNKLELHLSDAIATCYTTNGNELELFVPWRQRYYLFIRHLPEPYYTVYSTLPDNIPLMFGYDLPAKLTPHRKLGYAPLKNKNDPELNQNSIRAVSCMTQNTN